MIFTPPTFIPLASSKWELIDPPPFPFTLNFVADFTPFCSPLERFNAQLLIPPVSEYFASKDLKIMSDAPKPAVVSLDCNLRNIRLRPPRQRGHCRASELRVA